MGKEGGVGCMREQRGRIRPTQHWSHFLCWLRPVHSRPVTYPAGPIPVLSPSPSACSHPIPSHPHLPPVWCQPCPIPALSCLVLSHPPPSLSHLHPIWSHVHPIPVSIPSGPVSSHPRFHPCWSHLHPLPTSLPSGPSPDFFQSPPPSCLLPSPSHPHLPPVSLLFDPVWFSAPSQLPLPLISIQPAPVSIPTAPSPSNPLLSPSPSHPLHLHPVSIPPAPPYLPQPLDVGGDAREAVDAIYHPVLLHELGAAPQHLGHCGMGTPSLPSPTSPGSTIAHLPLAPDLLPAKSQG